MTNALTSIKGRRLGLGVTNELITNDIQITRPCVDATITVGDEAANVRAITIQLLAVALWCLWAMWIMKGMV